MLIDAMNCRVIGVQPDEVTVTDIVAAPVVPTGETVSVPVVFGLVYVTVGSGIADVFELVAVTVIGLPLPPSVIPDKLTV